MSMPVMQYIMRPYPLLLLCFAFMTNIVRAQNICKKRVFTQTKMGSPFTITLYGSDSLQMMQAAQEAFERVDELNRIFSDYMDSSELNRLSHTSGSGKAVPVSAALYDILERAKKGYILSEGAFDITVGPVIRIWRDARRTNRFPEAPAIRQALQRTGSKWMHLLPRQRAVRLDKAGMQLDLGGIAKGYVAQAVLAFLKEAGFPIAMVNAGGDLALGDAPPGRNGWRIAVAIPEQQQGYMHEILLLTDCAIATSGDVYQYTEWEGKRYSHIINPKTGYGVTTLRNTTVIAAEGATADWLASACNVLTIENAFRLVQQFPGTALLIAEKRGDSLYTKANTAYQAYTSANQ